MLVDRQAPAHSRKMNVNISCSHINIDTVKFSVDGVEMQVPDATTQMTTNKDAEIIYCATNRMPLAGIDGKHTLYYRYQPTKKRLTIEGSLGGYLFGQNVFTSWNVHRLCWEVLARAHKELRFRVDDETTARWRAGDIQLERVDLAVNFMLDSSDQVEQILQQAAQQLVIRTSMQKFGTTVYWAPRGGKAYKIGLYDKGRQMMASARARATPKASNRDTSTIAPQNYRASSLDRLSELCKKVLRMELRLNKAALRDRKLETAATWTRDSTVNVFKRYLQNVPLMNAIVGDIDTFDYSSLKPRQRSVVAIHLSGAPVNKIFAKSTRARHVTMFRKIGLDLKAKVSGKDAVELDCFFEGKQKKPPKWLREFGLRADWCAHSTESHRARIHGTQDAKPKSLRKGPASPPPCTPSMTRATKFVPENIQTKDAKPLVK